MIMTKFLRTQVAFNYLSTHCISLNDYSVTEKNISKHPVFHLFLLFSVNALSIDFRAQLQEPEVVVTYLDMTKGTFHWATRPPTGDQPVTRSQWNASGRPISDRPAAGKCLAARHRRFHGFLKIDRRGIFTLFGAGHRFLKIDGHFDLDE